MREGVISHEMYCIAEGSCRVTQHIRGGDDEERVRIWIEVCLHQTISPILLQFGVATVVMIPLRIGLNRKCSLQTIRSPSCTSRTREFSCRS